MVVVVREWMESEGTNDDRTRQDERIVKNILNTAQMHLVVGTVIMTMTLIACFTLSGLFESDTNSPKKGMTILLRRTTFRAFVVSNVITFACSFLLYSTTFALQQ